MPHRILLLGLDNLLLSDEGLGIYALDLLQARYDLPPEVLCIDGGVLGLELLAYVEGLDYLLVLDAIRGGRSPGTLLRLEGETIPKTLSPKLSMHQVSFANILALSQLRGTTPPHLVIWGLEPAVLDSGCGLSAIISAQLGALVDAAIDQLRQWGVMAIPRNIEEQSLLQKICHSLLPATDPSA